MKNNKINQAVDKTMEDLCKTDEEIEQEKQGVNMNKKLEQVFKGIEAAWILSEKQNRELAKKLEEILKNLNEIEKERKQTK